MLDTGCTRTCVQKDASFLANIKLAQTTTKIMCANQELMPSFGTVNLNLDFGSNLKMSTNALVVEHLSTPVIIGLDVIESLVITKNSSFVMLNNCKLKLCDPLDNSCVAYINKTVVLEPNCDTAVSIKNKFINSKPPGHNTIVIDGLAKQKSNHAITIIPGIYQNDESVNIMVTNRSNKRIRLKKRLPICTIESIKLDQCNGVRVLTDEVGENEMIRKFQDAREIKAEKTNFHPEIGSFGDIDAGQKAKFEKLVQDNRLAFSMGSNDLGRLGHFAFTLPMLDERETSHQPPRAIPVHLREKVKDEITTWKELGIIEPSQSGFNIPLIILKKKDDSIRISLDARDLNTKLQQDRYPLAHMSTVFTKIGEKLSTGKECWISVFDFHRGYWQIRVAPEDTHKLSFSHDGQHYKATRMLYGTSTSPACFSRVAMKLFGDNDSYIIYLDDFLIIDSSEAEHEASLKNFFQKCQAHGILLSPKKSQICMSSITFLGHKITRNGLLPLDKHQKAIAEFPRPSNKQALKRYLGMLNFNLRFIKNASITLKPLYTSCSTKTDFNWGPEQESAFVKIKKELLGATGLYHRNPALPLVLVTDASMTGVGATLYQINDQEYEVIAYFSRALSNADCRRSMRIKELLAVVYAIRSMEYYLLNVEFRVITDHKSLLFLYREHLRTALDAKLTNIWYYLQNFSFHIVHAAGASDIMKSADCLSRIPSSSLAEMEEILNQNEIPDRIFSLLHLPEKSESNTPKMKVFLRALALGNEKVPDQDDNFDKNSGQDNEQVILRFEDYNLTKSEMLIRQEKCPIISNIRKKLELKSKTAIKKYVFKNELIYKNDKEKLRVVIPQCVSDEFLQYVHVSYGHCGTFQLMKIVNRYVNIPNVGEKANRVCRSCVDCLRNKSQKTLRPSLIKKRSFEDTPWHKTSVDLFDLGKSDYRGKRYLVTAVDHLTGFVEAVPISNKTDKLVSQAMLEMVLRHGITGVVTTDNGNEMGQLFQAVLQKFTIRHVRTAAYQSRSNGRVERIHREIVSKFKLLDTKRNRWSDNWLYVQYLINNLPKTNLDGLSASEALYGRSLHVPFETIDAVEGQSEPYVMALNKYLNDIHPALMQFQYEKYAKLIEKDHKGVPSLKIGSSSLVWKPDIKEGKLSKSWTGPFTVIRRISKDTYILRDSTTKRTYRRNIRHLRPIKSSETDKNEHPETAEISKSDQSDQLHDEFENRSYFFDLPHYQCQ